MNQQYPSILLEKAVGEFSKLPGIGRKTAMRLVLHLLRQDTATVEAFGNSDRKSTRLNSSHMPKSRMPSSA